jgi:hypothetical protein
MVIHIHTQYRENYGTESEPYFKFKGGSTYVVALPVPLDAEIGEAARAAVALVRGTIEYANPMSEEYILDWELVEDDVLTPDEKDQLEFDGKITSPSKRITV